MLGKLIQGYMEAMHLPPSQWTTLVFPSSSSSPSSALKTSLHSSKDSAEYIQARETLIQVGGHMIVM